MTDSRKAFICSVKVSGHGHPHGVLMCCCIAYKLVSVTSCRTWLVKKQKNIQNADLLIKLVSPKAKS